VSVFIRLSGNYYLLQTQGNHFGHFIIEHNHMLFQSVIASNELSILVFKLDSEVHQAHLVNRDV
jgi:hypothetical protein